MKKSYKNIDNRRMSRKISLATHEKRRKTNCCKEFKLLCGRSATMSIRTPIGFVAVLVMAFFNSFFLSNLFGGVGSAELKRPVPIWSKEYDRNDRKFTAHN